MGNFPIKALLSINNAGIIRQHSGRSVPGAIASESIGLLYDFIRASSAAHYCCHWNTHRPWRLLLMKNRYGFDATQLNEVCLVGIGNWFVLLWLLVVVAIINGEPMTRIPQQSMQPVYMSIHFGYNGHGQWQKPPSNYPNRTHPLNTASTNCIPFRSNQLILCNQ